MPVHDDHQADSLVVRAHANAPIGAPPDRGVGSVLNGMMA